VGWFPLLERLAAKGDKAIGEVEGGREEGKGSERESVAEFKARQLVSQLLSPLLQPSLASKETAEGVPDTS
jgi:hypothetical protein